MNEQRLLAALTSYLATLDIRLKALESWMMTGTKLPPNAMEAMHNRLLQKFFPGVRQEVAERLKEELQKAEQIDLSLEEILDERPPREPKENWDLDFPKLLDELMGKNDPPDESDRPENGDQGQGGNPTNQSP